MPLVYDLILQAELVWPQTANQSYTMASSDGAKQAAAMTDSSYTGNFRTRVPDAILNATTETPPISRSIVAETGEEKDVLKTVGFIFHKISLTISVILVLWVSDL